MVEEESFKICPKCKVNFPKNKEHFYILKCGKVYSYCKKCSVINRYECGYRKGEKKKCRVCNSEFIKPKNMHHKGYFCSNKCRFISMQKDDNDYLKIKGLQGFYRDDIEW